MRSRNGWHLRRTDKKNCRCIQVYNEVVVACLSLFPPPPFSPFSVARAHKTSPLPATKEKKEEEKKYPPLS